MKQEDKELLLKDLCARLPYNVKFYIEDFVCTPRTLTSICKDGRVTCVDVYRDIEKIKPYLFPLSSMTEEQKAELEQIKNSEDAPYYHDINDFFLKHHLDNRHLIEKGLAIDATGLNIY